MLFFETFPPPPAPLWTVITCFEERFSSVPLSVMGHPSLLARDRAGPLFMASLHLALILALFLGTSSRIFSFGRFLLGPKASLMFRTYIFEEQTPGQPSSLSRRALSSALLGRQTLWSLALVPPASSLARQALLSPLSPASVTTPTRVTRGCWWLSPDVPPQASCKLDLPTPTLTGFFLSTLHLSFQNLLVSACPRLLLLRLLADPFPLPVIHVSVPQLPSSAIILLHLICSPSLHSLATHPFPWLHWPLAHTSVIPGLCLQPSRELETHLSHCMLMSISV